MTPILIKSFNRAFYLDRCIGSIHQQVRGDYKIVVLDDGTPAEYLAKIADKYPDIEIRRSPQYDTKQKLVREQKEVNGFQIPTRLWRSAVQQAEDYVLVTEDDVWFTNPVDIKELIHNLKKFDIHLLKLGWMGKQNEITKVQKLTDHLLAYDLKGIFTAPAFVMDWFMYNKWKFFSMLYRLKLVDNDTKEAYWRLNSIHMGLWRKDYWLHVWKDSEGKVDEVQQLRNAANWLYRHKKDKNLIARLGEEIVKTTFQSSATNSYHGIGFNVNYLNYLLNEAWLKGDFEPLHNYPHDFSIDYFESFFDEKLNKTDFEKWVNSFKENYKKVGVAVE